jgi:3-hydroxyacyl-CoA dehydrogenase
VAVIGAGTMGTGIALTFANAGIPVHVIEPSEDALARASAGVRRTYAQMVERGRIDAAEGDARLARIDMGAPEDALAQVDLAIEAAFEDLAVKREIFERLGARTHVDAILATNTSTLDVDAIAAAAPHPERSLGLHFFSPANVMRLLEIVRGARTSEATLATAVALGERLGKVPVVVGNCDGFVGNRMLHKYRREAELLLEAGATPQHVDGVLRAFGFAMGPF